MSKRKLRLRNLVFSVLGIALTLVLVAAASVLTVLDLPNPKRSGTVGITGLSGSVKIMRDRNGIAHIYASSDLDLFMAQGYVHAQERFFEMDFRRHLTAGRLSELLGDAESAKKADVVIRNLGWRKLAQQEWGMLSGQARSYYEAYAQGVNTYLEGKAPWQIANEYTVLSLKLPVAKIKPWSGVDSLAWLKAMAWDLAENLDDEVARVVAYQALGDTAKVEELFPTYAQHELLPVIAETATSNLDEQDAYPRVQPRKITVPDFSAVSVKQDNLVVSDQAAAVLSKTYEVLRALPEILGQDQGVGSNSFAVSGKHTASGKPVIANDPHLTINYPSVWFQVGLHCTKLSADCTFDMSGFSFAGMPGVIIGRNPDLAWSLTNLGGDVTDFVLEKNLGNDTYERDGKPVKYEVWTEKFKVAGGKDYTVKMRRSVHGPIISDSLLDQQAAGKLPHAPGDFSVALEWTALKPDTTGEAIFAINRAKNAKDIAKAASLFAVPAQNILFATASGDIGYQAPGRFPVRPVRAAADTQLGVAHSADNLGADGRWPRPGWDSSYDWQGYYAASDMPAVLNPASGILVPANQQVTYRGQGPFLGSYYDAGFRAQQIRDLLEQKTAAGDFDIVAANQVMLADKSPYGTELGKALSSATLKGDLEQQMQKLYTDWLANGAHADVEAVGMTIAAGVYAHLLHQVLADDVPGFKAVSGSRYIVLLEQLLRDPQHYLWDNRETAAQETSAETIQAAFSAAAKDLRKQLGKEPLMWGWGKVHTETPTHKVFGDKELPSVIFNLFNKQPLPVPGGSAIPNAMNFSPEVVDGSVSFEVTSGPSMRLAVDLANVDSALWITSSGVSGQPRSENIADQAGLWATGKYLPWHFSRQAVAKNAKHTLTLLPE